MSGAVALSLRSLATGLPASFLMAGSMPCAAQSTGKTLILAMSDDGESINSYAPGTYSSDSNDPRSQISRASVLQLGRETRGQINGQDVTAADFENSALFTMGTQQVEGARFLSLLPQSLLDRTSFFHLRTAANGHPEGQRVHQVNGALASSDGRGQEEIQSAIMQELLLSGAASGSVLNTPMVFNGGGGRLSTLTYEGTAITRYSALDVKNLFLTSNDVSLANLNKVYDQTIDDIYKTIKRDGTLAQKKYLDTFASSRRQASILGDQLGDLLSEVSGTSKEDQIKAAIGMAKANVSPVIVIRYAFSGDNHNDANLAEELNRSIEQMNNLERFWSLVQSEGMEERVHYATFDIFGRTLGRNVRGGRDHHNSSCVNLMVGPNINPGVFGGLEAWSKGGHRLMRATGINTSTGLSANPDIEASQTLIAYSRTLMSSMGISEERINARISSSKTIFSALTS